MAPHNESRTIPLWSLSDDALVESGAADGSLVVLTRWGEHTLQTPGPLVRESLRRMSMGPVSVENVMFAPVEDHGRQLKQLEDALAPLGGSVVRSLGLTDGQSLLLSVVPNAPCPAFRMSVVGESRPVRLSRFASMRPCGGELVLESPLAQFRVVAHADLTCRVIAALATPLAVGELAAAVGVAPSAVADIVGYLVASGTVVQAGEDGAVGDFPEDCDHALREWTHHELAFHIRSRSSRADASCDPTEPEAASDAPAVKPPPAGTRFPLVRPDLTAPGPGSQSLTELLEVDHSCPEPSERPLTSMEIGELLFRSARVRGPGPAHLPHGMTHEATQRPYVNIACLYELELYLAVDRCADLPRAAFHYDPATHALTLVNDDGCDLDEILDMVTVAAGTLQRPPLVVSVTARMERMAALGGAAYATTLMHVGAFQQTLHLVAKTMGLAAHPVPVDASDTVDRVLGLRWPAEVGVGECVISYPL